jgi:hypothetical protein
MFEPPLPRRAKRRCIPAMIATIESPAEDRTVTSSTVRSRRHRERRRECLRLFTVEVPEHLIDEALARDLLKPEDRTDWWAVIQACYAAQLSEAAFASPAARRPRQARRWPWQAAAGHCAHRFPSRGRCGPRPPVQAAPPGPHSSASPVETLA